MSRSKDSRQSWIQRVDRALQIPQEKRSERVIDLFAGCGGLALGFESVGFQTQGFEAHARYAETYSHNLSGECVCVKLTPDTQYLGGEVLIGGPPCQPFSVGGNQKGLKDARDGFPTFVAAVKKLNPRIFLFENVRGLLYRNKQYFEEIKQELEALGYSIDARLLNAKHYSVPQNRERVIVIGHHGGFKFPPPQNNLVSAEVALGEMFDRVPEDPKWLTPSMDAYIAKYEKASCCKNPRDLHRDRPARTLTCRNLAGATGDMHRIRHADGRRRRITVREAARLQSFPDWFTFVGSETEQYYQIGNAVSPLFAKALAQSIAEYLDRDRQTEYEQDLKSHRDATQLALF